MEFMMIKEDGAQKLVCEVIEAAASRCGSYNKLAKLADVNPASLWRVRTGKGNISATNFIKILILIKHDSLDVIRSFDG